MCYWTCMYANIYFLCAFIFVILKHWHKSALFRAIHMSPDMQQLFYVPFFISFENICANKIEKRKYLCMPFSALMLLVGWQERWGTGMLSVWSKVQMSCIWPSWCYCTWSVNINNFLQRIYKEASVFIKIQNDLPFWCRLT